MRNICLLPLPASGERAGVRGESSTSRVPFVQLSQNFSQHSLGSLEHVIIPESDYAITSSFKGCSARLVVRLTLGMLSAVEFHNQARLFANEIDEVRPNLVLSAELVAFEPAVAQMVPEPCFRIGLRTAQGTFTRMVLFAAHSLRAVSWLRTPHPGPLPAGGERGKSL